MGIRDYFQPGTVEEAVNYLNKFPDKTKVLAGGTDLLVKMKERVLLPMPEILVDINRINSLKVITEDPGWLKFGPLIRLEELADLPLIKEKAAVVAEAAAQVGSPQIRNRGTVGGNVVNASPAADTVPALLALDAQVEIQGLRNQRVLALADFFTGPGQTCLLPGELITALKVRPIRHNEGASFMKFGKRKSLAISVTNGAVWIAVEHGIINAARIALGAVAPTPIRLYSVEDWLVGKTAEAAVFAEAGAKVSNLVKPIDDIRGNAVYRKRLTQVIVARCLQTAWEKVSEVSNNG